MIDNYLEIEAEGKGAHARRKGIVIGDNPYPETSELHWRWIKGWTDEAMRQRKMPRRVEEVVHDN
jgi:hypothetical protein